MSSLIPGAPTPDDIGLRYDFESHGWLLMMAGRARRAGFPRLARDFLRALKTLKTKYPRRKLP